MKLLVFLSFWIFITKKTLKINNIDEADRLKPARVYIYFRIDGSLKAIKEAVRI